MSTATVSFTDLRDVVRPGFGAQGFDPTEIFVRCAPRVSATE